MIPSPHNQNENPFSQAESYFHLLIETERGSVPLIESAFGEEAVSISAFEEKDSPKWKVDILLAGDMAAEHELETCIRLLEKAGANITAWQCKPMQQRDWVSDLQKQFPPLEEGRFFIHGSHIPPRARPEISLEINAGAAFGTGEHETTALCLQALQKLHDKGVRPLSLFDLGSGTGILAVAAQKLWPKARVTGSDMDAVSIAVARENAVLNHAPRLRFHVATGFQHAQLAPIRGQEVIVANILARPLIALAPEIIRRMAPGGHLVLSGLLNRQEKAVLMAYRGRGLQLVKTLHRNGWSALVLQKA